MKPRAYDWMYKYWAPWDAVGVRQDLKDLLARGRIDPSTHPRSVDLGCGTGANVVHLAERGFDSWGIDFSEVALGKARERAEAAGVKCHWVRGDLTADAIPGVGDAFDFLIDFGTLDDLRGANRRAMVRTIDRLSRPGSVFLEWCFYGPVEDLPLFSLNGPSRVFLPLGRARKLAPTLVPGEVEELFGDKWAIEPLSANPDRFVASFVLTKNG